MKREQYHVKEQYFVKEPSTLFTCFLDASSHLLMMVCPSVSPSVCPSVSPLQRSPFFEYAKMRVFDFGDAWIVDWWRRGMGC